MQGTAWEALGSVLGYAELVGDVEHKLLDTP